MCKREESPADRVWKEKLAECASPEEAVILLVVAAALVTGFLLVSALGL
jgi:hypothetical protein